MEEETERSEFATYLILHARANTFALAEADKANEAAASLNEAQRNS